MENRIYSHEIESFSDEEFKILKGEFDRLSSYSEKLKFFEIHFPFTHKRNFGYCNKLVEEYESWTEADQISVLPQLKRGDKKLDKFNELLTERKQYFEWIEPKMTEFSFENRKAIFFEEFENSANKDEFINFYRINTIREVNLILNSKSQFIHSSFYYSKQKGYEGLVYGKKIDFTNDAIFDNFKEIINFIDGRSLAYFKNFIDNFDLNQFKSNPKKSKVFTNVEKILILTFYQSVADFPNFDPKIGQTKKEFQNVIAVLTGDDVSVIKDAFSKVQKILDKKDITKGSAPTKLKSLEVVKQYFISTKNSFLEEQVQNLMDEISRISGYYTK